MFSTFRSESYFVVSSLRIKQSVLTPKYFNHSVFWWTGWPVYRVQLPQPCGTGLFLHTTLYLTNLQVSHHNIYLVVKQRKQALRKWGKILMFVWTLKKFFPSFFQHPKTRHFCMPPCWICRRRRAAVKNVNLPVAFGSISTDQNKPNNHYLKVNE